MRKEFSKEELLNCIKGKVFKQEEELTITELNEENNAMRGFINYVYRVKNKEGKSVIIKEARPYMRHFGKDGVELTTERIQLEYQSIKLRNSITPKYVPKVYYLDCNNNFMIMEDLGELEEIRFGLIRGEQYKDFTWSIAEYIAKSSFYTSGLYLDDKIHKRLVVKFINPDMRDIMENVMYRFDYWENDLSNISEEQKELTQHFLADKGLRVEMYKMRDIFMGKTQCLVHGDLHTSNIMINHKELKVMDMEYTFMGPFSADLGYLCANFIYLYVGAIHSNKTEVRDGAKVHLESIKQILENYRGLFREYFDADAKEHYKKIEGYVDDILETTFQESIGFIACPCICSCVKGVEIEEFKHLTEKDTISARRLCIYICRYLLSNRYRINNEDELVKYIERTANIYMKMMRP